MKARCSPTTAKDMLSPAQKKAIEAHVDARWRARQRSIMKRFLLAMCLSLNDLYGFGDKRLMLAMNGIADILEDYAAQSFTPSEARTGTIQDGEADPMAEAMQAELLSRRKIHIEIGEFMK